MPFLSTILSALLFAGLAARIGSAHELNLRQASSGILINPPGFPPLPTVSQATSIAATNGLNLSNIQGDILIGMRKKKELFFFFGIRSVSNFKSKLASDIHPRITNTAQLLDSSTPPATALNLAFSQSGLTSLGINGSNILDDGPFSEGQAAGNGTLGDPGTENWVPGFVDTSSLHGVFLLASDTIDNINIELANIQSILGDSIVEIHRLQGEARPGAEGHEHFGFLDGISQPGVVGFTTSFRPGQAKVPAGTFLLGHDTEKPQPEWATDGSFLAFRQLKQLVPEFNKFLADNPIVDPQLTVEQGSALMGARMMGRWKSGAPVDLAPLFDDPVLAADPNRNNDFNFTLAVDQSRCPFAAHIRKTNPRGDIPGGFPANHIIRGGTPYGPEVTPEEAASNTTSVERGLAFVSYQSNITNGFQFLQRSWANTPSFFPHPGVTPGFDPIIGANKGMPRDVTGLDLTNQTRTITLPSDFIVSRGGEYFFSPSLSAILNTLAV